MRILRSTLIVIVIIAMTSSSSVWGQSGTSAYNTEFTTAITYQNTGTSTANIQFKFFNQSGTSINPWSTTLAAGAGTSLTVDGLLTLFTGGTVVTADQDLISTIVCQGQVLK